MEEKIKITLPPKTLELLRKDCVDFGITKSDSSPNMNSFVNMLVVNFYESFLADEEDITSKLKGALCNLPERYRDDVFSDVKRIMNRRDSTADEKNGRTMAFKPTKSSEAAVLYIASRVSKDESLSSFYRRMFSAYSAKTKNEREKIIFKETHNALKSAESEGIQVLLKLKNGVVMTGLSVYAVASSKDELFNYLLAYDGKKNVTLRLSKIALVHPLSERANVPEENAGYFDRQIRCGAQYQIYNTDNKPIKVQLSPKGKELFNKIYLYRPTPVSIEGDIYTFDCSANQVLYYFERFGESALILSPAKLGIFMRNYYYFAYKKYKNQYKQ